MALNELSKTTWYKFNIFVDISFSVDVILRYWYMLHTLIGSIKNKIGFKLMKSTEQTSIVLIISNILKKTSKTNPFFLSLDFKKEIFLLASLCIIFPV